ncbi:glutathione S-transferase family protein [Parasphingopyxis marina]|uniref:Glutathione S-transferase n=1 Tax=Parasphingopyxis marina TaxID=2761622 RepID=A0A842HVD0_9SPHN|nr:glutathione S-transferase family protein [Parasphingopyxis marina]MBC2777046.1 glutathione S-transferase [Parasphingopyxis marina]
MKLFWSSRSPYARKALLVAHEVGLADRIEPISIAIPQREENPALAAASPMRKLPTLVTDDGEAIIDSPVIAEYLDTLGGGKLVPRGDGRWRALSLQAMADEVLQILLLWRRELRRPEAARSAPLLDDFAVRLDRALDWLEAAPQFGKDFTIGEATCGIMLSYLDFRFAERPWRPGRERLAAWHESFEDRPSAVATRFSDG